MQIYHTIEHETCDCVFQLHKYTQAPGISLIAVTLNDSCSKKKKYDAFLKKIQFSRGSLISEKLLWLSFLNNISF